MRSLSSRAIPLMETDQVEARYPCQTPESQAVRTTPCANSHGGEIGALLEF
jgi:hypothetical protein